MTSGSPPELKNSIGSATTSADAHASSTIPCTSGASSVSPRAPPRCARSGCAAGARPRAATGCRASARSSRRRTADRPVDERDGEHTRASARRRASHAGRTTASCRSRRRRTRRRGTRRTGGRALASAFSNGARRSYASIHTETRSRRAMSSPSGVGIGGGACAASASCTSTVNARPPAANRLGATCSRSRSRRPSPCSGLPSPHSTYISFSTAPDLRTQTRRASGRRPVASNP